MTQHVHKQIRIIPRKVQITSREISETWQVLCAVYSSKGIDLRKLLNEAATSKAEWLSRWGCEADFDKLRKAGCSDAALVIALWIIRSAPSWTNTWRAVVGSRRRRNQTISALEGAASALERLETSLGEALSHDKRARNHKQLSRTTNTERVDSEPNFKENLLPRVPTPLALIRVLRMYSRVLKGFDDVAKRTRIHSPEAFGRYLISEVVMTATDEYHDQEVSALIGGALGETYSETAHRMWRSRNYRHIKAVSLPVELLIGLGALLANEA